MSKMLGAKYNISLWPFNTAQIQDPNHLRGVFF
jgi:hypothetical protein